MPNNLLTTDVMFPDLHGKSQKEQISIITNYLFMLLEQLRYTLANLGADNFNESELDGLQKTFTGPIQIQITDMEGNLNTITATVDGLSTEVSDVAGNYSQLSQTVSGLQSTVVNLNGEFSQVKQDVDGLQISTSGGVTYISGNHVKSGTISGSVLQCDLNSSQGSSNGELQFRYNGQVVGRLQMDTYGNTDGSGGESRYRVFLEAMNGFVLKLLSEDNMSINSSGGDVYLSATGGKVHISGRDNPIIMSGGDGAEYTFRDDGIYMNNRKITN